MQEDFFEGVFFLGFGAEFGEGAEGEEFAAVDDADAVGDGFGDVEGVRAHEDGAAVFGVFAEEVFDGADGARVEADHGFVDDEDRWFVQHGRGEDDLLFHAVAIAFGELVEVFADVEAADERSEVAVAAIGFDAVHFGDEVEELAAGEFFVEEGLVGDVGELSFGCEAVDADFVAADADGAVVGLEQADDHFDGGGFACAVVTEECEEFSARDGEREPGHGEGLAVTFGDGS